MKTKKLFIFIMSLVLGLSLVSGCVNTDTGTDATTGDDGTGTTTTQPAASGDFDFYIFNTKGENAEAMENAANAYEDITGQVVKVFSLGAGTDSSDALRADMNSADNMPTIFSIMNLQELREWVEGGFALELGSASDPDFTAMHDAIPNGLRLTNDGTNSYGIPYNVEGYGYIVDTLLLADLFGSENVDSFLADFKEASYDEFEDLVLTLDLYIKDDAAGSVDLNGQSYTFADEKGDLSATLNGVFATAGSQTWTYGDHMINIAIDTVFANPAAAASATDEQIESLRNPFLAYAEALDLKTSHAAGNNGPLARGPEFINTTTASYDASVQILADHKAVFLKQGNWVYTNIERVNDVITETLTFLPVKMPFEQSDIQVDGLTVEHMRSSIPVFVPNYYAINAKATADQQEKAQQFLVWLNTSDEGRKFIIEDMAFIPYNADPDTTTLPNSLGQSILEYIKSDNTITNAYAGAPTNWSGDTVGRNIMENYLTKEEWTASDYEDIADHAVDQWQSMKG